ncbi:MAG: hypothetical protein QGI45_10065, partial [Myxococcota bacterium]|nr:hypothetical protein [Myxococcota bacterium]
MLRSDAQTKTFCFAVFSLIYLTLGIHSYQKKSATFDEPVHMASAYAQVVLDDHRIDPTHPPLLRLWAGLPMWFEKEGLSFNQESDAWKDFNQW